MNAHLDRILIGGRERRPIVLAEPDPDWPVGEVADAALVPPLEQAGCRLRVREPGHLMLRTRERDVQVHIWADHDPETARHLAFRDRLRASPSDRAAYERLKRALAAREWEDMNHYAEAKTALIREILARGR